MSADNPILNGCLYKKIEAAERLEEITPFTTGRVQKVLSIGYGQAAQIVDLFIQLGIVSIRDDNGNRHPLVLPREAAIRVIRYMHQEFEKAEEALHDLFLDYEKKDFFSISDDLDDEDREADPFEEVALMDEPTSPPSRQELLRKAVEIACSLERIGTSYLQRRLRIGYGRAAVLIDTMEMLGIVGPDLGTKTGREVLLSPEESIALIESYFAEET